jgi:hypothetical protein
MLANTDSRPPRVLTADLTWEPVQSLDVGQQVVTFDANPTDHRYRMYRIGRVTDLQTIRTETLRVTTADAEIDVAATHPFFVKKWNKTMFRDAEKLEPDDHVFWFAPPTDYDENAAYKRGYLMGAFAGDGSVPGYKERSKDPRNAGSYVSSVDEEVGRTVVEYAADVAPEYRLALKERRYNGNNDTATMPVSPGASDRIIRGDLRSDHPTTDEDFARGWLAGMFDTDGTFPKGKELGYCQYEGPIFDQVCEYLDLLGYEWSHDEGERGEFSDKVRLTPGRETGRVFEHLMEIKPEVYRKRLSFVGNRRIGGHTTVTTVESVGTESVYHVETTDGTLIAEGLLSAARR